MKFSAKVINVRPVRSKFDGSVRVGIRTDRTNAVTGGIIYVSAQYFSAIAAGEGLSPMAYMRLLKDATIECEIEQVKAGQEFTSRQTGEIGKYTYDGTRINNLVFTLSEKAEDKLMDKAIEAGFGMNDPFGSATNLVSRSSQTQKVEDDKDLSDPFDEDGESKKTATPQEKAAGAQ